MYSQYVCIYIININTSIYNSHLNHSILLIVEEAVGLVNAGEREGAVISVVVSIFPPQIR